MATSNGEAATSQERLLVVANRLPMTVLPSSTAEKGYRFTMSSGGLVSGLRGIKGVEFLWLGWPGNEVAEKDQVYVVEECAAKRCYPVFLSQETIDLFYNGFCNNVLWPLFHYVPPPMEIAAGRDQNDEEELWEAYVRANRTFVDAILEVYQDTDLVWVHDYHLMLVPQLLRERQPNARIGWFLHTPFPSQEMFRILTYRAELLIGLLSANFIGFHVYDYLRHFMGSCAQILGLESAPHGVDAQPLGGVFVRCGAIPIGIEPSQFFRKLREPQIREAVRKLRAQFGQKRIILGVDRLDYMKGVPHKLKAFDRFLELHPEWALGCVLVQVAVPTRTVVPEYRRLRSTVHELVGRINGRRGNLTHVPVHYLDQSLSFDELVALYRVADVALITSIRDGMNLVAYEYIASQAGKHGVLVLSEFTGAAQSLGAGSLRVNPWNTDETATAIFKALTMSSASRRAQFDYALKHVVTHTSQKWARLFLESLREASDRSVASRDAVPPLLNLSRFLRTFTEARRKLLLVDLRDSLTAPRSVKDLPTKRFSRTIALPPATRQALALLASGAAGGGGTLAGVPPAAPAPGGRGATVIISTPHPVAALERLFDLPGVGLAAEKGALYRDTTGRWTRFVVDRHQQPQPLLPARVAGAPAASVAAADAAEIDCEGWMGAVLKVFQFFERRTPGSFTEQTTGSLTWYWDDCPPDLGKQQSRELLVHLWTAPIASSSSTGDLEVVVGHRCIEVRDSHCSRARLLERILKHEFALIRQASPGGDGVAAEDPFPLDVAACIGSFPRRDEDVHNLFSPLSAKSGHESANAKLSNCLRETKSYRKNADSIYVKESVTAAVDENAAAAQEAVASAFAAAGTQSESSTAKEAAAPGAAAASAGAGGGSADACGETVARPVERYFSVSIGARLSRAKYCLSSCDKVQNLIVRLAAALDASPDASAVSGGTPVAFAVTGGTGTTGGTSPNTASTGVFGGADSSFEKKASGLESCAAARRRRSILGFSLNEWRQHERMNPFHRSGPAGSRKAIASIRQPWQGPGAHYQPHTGILEAPVLADPNFGISFQLPPDSYSTMAHERRRNAASSTYGNLASSVVVWRDQIPSLVPLERSVLPQSDDNSNDSGGLNEEAMPLFSFAGSVGGEWLVPELTDLSAQHFVRDAQVPQNTLNEAVNAAQTPDFQRSMNIPRQGDMAIYEAPGDRLLRKFQQFPLSIGDQLVNRGSHSVDAVPGTVSLKSVNSSSTPSRASVDLLATVANNFSVQGTHPLSRHPS